MQKDRIYKILKDYQNAKIDKHGAMMALGIDHVGELLSLLHEYKIPPEDSSAYFQSDASQPEVGAFFRGE